MTQKSLFSVVVAELFQSLELSTLLKLFTNGRPLSQGLSSISSDTIKSLDGPVGELLSGGEELGEVGAESFIYRLIKVIIDVQGI